MTPRDQFVSLSALRGGDIILCHGNGKKDVAANA